ncbi:hypothetical protein FB451DRAFT_1040194, partial [Mycena latifolia]
LPSELKIFHGRESEVSGILQTFGQETTRIAILGGGGMGKTSLARIILHHPEISARYQQYRFFVPCDAASSSIQLAALIGAHIGLKPAKDLTTPVIHHFMTSPPSLLILDNLETIWEPREGRGDTEKLLSLLADIDHLALMITMRGAERPANVQWTRPFLAPMKPLTQEESRKTFSAIVDGGYTVEEMDKILSLADNMPLAIDLLAHLVDYEGLHSVLNRWKTERTSMLSDGLDKGSNLNLSISLSLESPRLASLPHSCQLLSLLSILPDGLLDIDLLQSKLPFDSILACKAALIRTSLAYTDDQKRLKALVPIREYMYQRHPPMSQLVQPLVKHFNNLLEVYDTYYGTISSPEIVAQITANLANIQSILGQGLKQDNPDLGHTIQCICHFDRFTRRTGHGQVDLIHQIPNFLPYPKDPRLEVYFIATLLAGRVNHLVQNPEGLFSQGLEWLPHFDDPDMKCWLCIMSFS